MSGARGPLCRAENYWSNKGYVQGSTLCLVRRRNGEGEGVAQGRKRWRKERGGAQGEGVAQGGGATQGEGVAQGGRGEAKEKDGKEAGRGRRKEVSKKRK